MVLFFCGKFDQDNIKGQFYKFGRYLMKNVFEQ